MKVVTSLQPLENFVLGIKRPLKNDLVWVLVNAYPEFDENEQFQHVVVSFVDITKQKEASIYLARNNRKFRNLSQSASEMLNLKSVGEIYEYLTNSLHKQFPNEVILFLKIDEEQQMSNIVSIKGVSQKLVSQAVNLTGYDFFKKSYRLIPEFTEMFRSGVFHHYTGGLAEFVGNQFPQMAAKAIEKMLGIHRIYTIGIVNGNKLFAIIHLLNRSKEPITDSEYIESFVKQAGIIIERKQAEEQLQLSESILKEMNATKDKFFSIISHDLRNPISSILSLTELLADDTYDLSPEDMHKLLQSIHKNTQSTYQLLENLLEWSRLQKGVVPFDNQIINLKEFVGTCDYSVVEMASNKSIELIIDIQKGLKVNADSNMLRSILRNLVTNAIKFTPEGGSVLIKASKFDQQTVLLSIKDTGLGMKKELIDQLFRIDTQVSRPGTNNEPSTGLGLIITKEFVDRHGGRIWVDSEVGNGSTFNFTLTKG
jgi:signal transduction histidine kinase